MVASTFRKLSYAKITFVSEPENSKRRRISPWVAGIFVLVSLTVLVLLQTSNLWKDFSVETASDTLLLYALSSLNFIAFVIFGFIFLRSITKLARERRALQLGAKIKTRLLLYFAAVSVLPIIAMAGFSYLFMNRAIERWFTQIPENVVRKARDVQSQAVQDQSTKLQETARMLGTLINDRAIKEGGLREIAEAGNLTRIEVRSSEGQLLGFSERTLEPEQKAELDATLEAARNDPTGSPVLQDGKGYDAAVWTLTDGRRLIIVPNLRSDQSVSQMVDNSLIEFDRLKDKQATIRQIGLLTLGVLTFLLIFASSWTAFYIARGLTVPIKALAQGAEEIARGNLSHRVDVLAEDELSLLVATFNDMSQRLQENSEEISERRRYIETILESLPTGVISFDRDGKVSTLNRAAEEMLRLKRSEAAGSDLSSTVGQDTLEILRRIMARARRMGRAAEQAVLGHQSSESQGQDSRLPVAISATVLPENSGVVVLLEDLSELIAAQRASAWREVARRMAHEIKNPLTPIQLSAERIAKRVSAVEPAGAGIWSRSGDTVAVVLDGTETILREVSSLKAMVDEFSKFARLPEARPEFGNLNDVIRQVIALYEGRDEGAKFDTSLAADLPDSMFDSEQLKRVFVNLIENSIEAFDPMQNKNVVAVSSRFDPVRSFLIAEVSDNGKGIPASDLGKLFQPYFSTKSRGTGLGLAIVQRIISDHGGMIRAASNSGRGARFTIELPIGK